jgi:hypothetical protein
VSVLGDVFEDVQERVGVLRTLGVQLGRLQDGCGNAGIAEDGEQGVAVHHVVVLGIPVTSESSTRLFKFRNEEKA